MTDNTTYRYEPNTVTHPGESLKRTLNALGLNQVELARRTGQSQKHINQVVNGKATITPETALALERVLNVPASFWNSRQKQYDEALAEQNDRENLTKHISWLKNFPVKKMIEQGLLEPAKDRVEQLRNLLDFFGVAGPDQWTDEWTSLNVSFRQSPLFEASDFSVAAWLRAGEIVGRQMECASYSPRNFEQALLAVRNATSKDLDEFCLLAKQEFAKAGVALVFTPELPRTRVNGATRWLSPNRALIQLSFRHKRDDIFIFTLFHEAAHVLKHSKKDIFIEVDEAEDEREREADEFSKNFLIPPDRYEHFISTQNLTYLSHSDILEFANSLGIAPSIVVGRLHRENRVKKQFFHRHYRRIDADMLASAAIWK